MKLWSAWRNIGFPPGPAMLASMFDSRKTGPSRCSIRRIANGSWASSTKTSPLLSNVQTRWFEPFS